MGHDQVVHDLVLVEKAVTFYPTFDKPHYKTVTGKRHSEMTLISLLNIVVEMGTEVCGVYSSDI